MPEKKTIRVIRQGDVILWEIPELPTHAKRVEENDTIGNMNIMPDAVIIHGETGHNHTLTGVKVYKTWREVYVVVDKPVMLRHDEHPAVEIPKGVFVITHIQDYVMGRRALD